MNTSDQIRERLVARQQELEEEINRTDDDALDSGIADVQDPIDQVISSGAKSASLKVGTIEFRALQDVRAALDRLDQGTYGRCVVCGEQISPARLEAIPETPYCIRHAEEAARATEAADQPLLGG
jgi:DnaK suppressor protein